MNYYNRWRLEMYRQVYESIKSGRLSSSSAKKVIVQLLKEGPK